MLAAFDPLYLVPLLDRQRASVCVHYSPAFGQLQRLAASTRVPQSVYLREALDDLLRKYQKLRKVKG